MTQRPVLTQKGSILFAKNVGSKSIHLLELCILRKKTQMSYKGKLKSDLVLFEFFFFLVEIQLWHQVCLICLVFVLKCDLNLAIL